MRDFSIQPPSGKAVDEFVNDPEQPLAGPPEHCANLLAAPATRIV
jgi:hypothetical protein